MQSIVSVLVLAILTLAAPLLFGLSCKSPTEPGVLIDLPQQVSPGGYFTFSLPADMQGSSGVGTDDFIGTYTNGSITVNFDLGYFASDLGEFSRDTYGFYPFEINGWWTTLVLGRNPKGTSSHWYVAGVHYPNTGNHPYAPWILNVFAYGSTQASQDTAIAIFNTIQINPKIPDYLLPLPARRL